MKKNLRNVPQAVTQSEEKARKQRTSQINQILEKSKTSPFAKQFVTLLNGRSLEKARALVAANKSLGPFERNFLLGAVYDIENEYVEAVKYYVEASKIRKVSITLPMGIVGRYKADKNVNMPDGEILLLLGVPDSALAHGTEDSPVKSDFFFF